MADVFTHPWLGGLFGDAVTETALGPQHQMAAMLAVEKAHAAARHAAGEISDAAAAAVAAVLDGPQPDMAALREGAGQDGMVVPALIRQLRARLPERFQAALHSGLTSQDVIDSAFALSLVPVFDAFADRLARLAAGLDDLSDRHGANHLMGRTRMQAALPIRVADRIAVWRMPLAGLTDRLTAARAQVAILSAGGPVGTGLPDAVARDMADRLGLALPPRAPHAMRTDLAAFAATLSLITGALGKIGQDVALMAQQGIDEVELTSGGTSSAMPHKTNPIRAELLITLARFNATQLSGMHHAIVHEQERSGAAWTLEWMLLPQMIRATGASLLAALALTGEVRRIGQPDGVPS